MCTRYTIFKNWGYRGLSRGRDSLVLPAPYQMQRARSWWAEKEKEEFSGRRRWRWLHPGVSCAGHTPGSPGRARSGASMVVLSPGTAAAEGRGLKRGESWESTVGGFAPAKLSETKNGREARHQEFQVASTFHFSWYFSVSTACSC